MSKLSDALKELGYSDNVVTSLTQALSNRQSTAEGLLSAEGDSTKARIHILGEFAVGVIKGMLSASLDPAVHAKNVKDYEVIVSVISSALFELTVMMTMITNNDRIKTESVLVSILRTCLDEAERVFSEINSVEGSGAEDDRKPYSLH